MFATTHALAAIALSQTTSNLPTIFGLSFLSHIILDIIPHGDNILMANEIKEEPFSLSTTKSRKIRKYFLYALIDIALFAFIFLFFINPSSLDPFFVGTAIFGALLIDFISGAYKITKWRFLASFEHRHKWLHYLIAKHLPAGDISPMLSIILQIIFIVVVLRALTL